MFVIDHLVGQGACIHAREASADDAPSARGQELASLASCDLRDRFYSWRGASGQRYVCSIFRLDEESVVAEFSQAVVIGVVREGSTRRPVCVLRSRDFETDDGRAIRDDAHTLGVNEWHVRFGARDDIMLGLAAALLN